MTLNPSQLKAVHLDAPLIVVWKPVPGIGGCEASSIGSIRVNGVVRRQSTTGKYYKIGRGYLATRINRKLLKVSRLVAAAFIPNPNNLPEVNHKNGVTTDNRPGNLEWVTSSGNQVHAIANGLRIPLKGEEIGTSKFSQQLIREARCLREKGLTTRAIALKTGISLTHVKRIVKGKSWKHLL